MAQPQSRASRLGLTQSQFDIRADILESIHDIARDARRRLPESLENRDRFRDFVDYHFDAFRHIRLVNIYDTARQAAQHLPVSAENQRRISLFLYYYIGVSRGIPRVPVDVAHFDEYLTVIESISRRFDEQLRDLIPVTREQHQDVVGGVQEERQPGNDPGHDENGTRRENVGSGLRGGGAVRFTPGVRNALADAETDDSERWRQQRTGCRRRPRATWTVYEVSVIDTRT